MAILAYDDVMLREPRLLVPGMPPLGKVKASSLGLNLGLVEGIWAKGDAMPGSLSGIVWSLYFGAWPIAKSDGGCFSLNFTADAITGLSVPLRGISLQAFTFIYRLRRQTQSAGVWQCGTTVDYRAQHQTLRSDSGVTQQLDDDVTLKTLDVGLAALNTWEYYAMTGSPSAIYGFHAQKSLALVDTDAALADVKLNGQFYLGGSNIPGASGYHANVDFSWLLAFNKALPLDVMNDLLVDPFSVVEPA